MAKSKYWYEHRSKKKKQKIILRKLWKMWENRDIKLVTTEKRRNYLVSEPNYHTKRFSTEHLLTIEMKEIEISYE